MYEFEDECLSDVQLSISELSVVGGWWWVGGRDKRTSWSDLVGVRQKHIIEKNGIFTYSTGRLSNHSPETGSSKMHW